MRAPSVGVTLAVLLGAASFAAGIAPAEARTDHQRDSRQGAIAPHTQASRAAPEPHRTQAGSARTAGVHAAAAAAPRGGAAAQGGRSTRRVAAGGGSGSGGISCVPYVREVTGMVISGNGRDWWHNAAGLYDRGQRPEPGSVLAFPGSGGMSSGHVAVVSRVLSAREVLIDHANWAGPGIRRGTVMRGVSVVDVSPGNDWTQVRVQVGWNAGTYGRVYPTYGFIYNRPDVTGGTMLAGNSRNGPRVVSTAAATGLPRGQARRLGGTGRWEELAELPAASGGSPHASQHLDLSIRTLTAERR